VAPLLSHTRRRTRFGKVRRCLLLRLQLQTRRGGGSQAAAAKIERPRNARLS
jgi:hypothetical protein